jgi:hypothetical protein
VWPEFLRKDVDGRGIHVDLGIAGIVYGIGVERTGR